MNAVLALHQVRLLPCGCKARDLLPEGFSPRQSSGPTRALMDPSPPDHLVESPPPPPHAHTDLPFRYRYHGVITAKELIVRVTAKFICPLW